MFFWPHIRKGYELKFGSQALSFQEIVEFGQKAKVIFLNFSLNKII